MQPIVHGLCRWRARNSSRIILNLSSRLCAVTQPTQWGIVNGSYVKSDTRSPMTRFSQPSFLNGPPQPLVLTMDGQGRTPFELYRLIASPSQPSFLLDSGKGTSGGSRYSFLGSNPFSVLSGRQGQASLRTHDGRECSSKDPFGGLSRLFAGPWIEQIGRASCRERV